VAKAANLSGQHADHSNSTIAIRGCNIKLMRGGSGEPLLILHGASGAGDGCRSCNRWPSASM